MGIVSVKDRYNELMKAYDPKIKADVNASNAVYKQQSDTVSGDYNRQIETSKEDYNRLEKENAVQKLINEREIARNMAELGLTDSGLNRTQQTAVQLSHANNYGQIQRQKQQAVDALAQAMTAKLTEIETSRANAELGIRQGYEKMATTSATDAYNADVKAAQKAAEAQQKMQYNVWKAQLDAQTSLAKAQINAAGKQGTMNIINTSNGKLSYDYKGTLADNNVSVWYDEINGKTTYIDRITGKKTVMGYHENPYTGGVNPDTKYGTFENGYQPDNIGGQKLYPAKNINGNLAKTTVNGREYQVFSCKYGYYVWNGKENHYDRLGSTEAMSFGLTGHSGYTNSYH